ncbi:MAG TPA: TSUP family transporter, partial [Planctomycetota bacterium]|nr:TSUP family transporter [Planctomycetota bacterium]
RSSRRAGRSLWLHARDRRVDWNVVAWLVPGAAVGSALGVVTVHEPGVESAAQLVLAGVLLATAWSFARDVVRARRAFGAGQA